MADHGLRLADLTQKAAARKSKAAPGKSSTVAAKYCNLETGETWSGRGPKPNWLRAQIEAGRQIEDFAV